MVYKLSAIIRLNAFGTHKFSLFIYNIAKWSPPPKMIFQRLH